MHGVHGVGGSNPLAPTNEEKRPDIRLVSFYLRKLITVVRWQILSTLYNITASLFYEVEFVWV